MPPRTRRRRGSCSPSNAPWPRPIAVWPAWPPLWADAEGRAGRHWPAWRSRTGRPRTRRRHPEGCLRGSGTGGGSRTPLCGTSWREPVPRPLDHHVLATIPVISTTGVDGPGGPDLPPVASSQLVPGFFSRRRPTARPGPGFPITADPGTVLSGPPRPAAGTGRPRDRNRRGCRHHSAASGPCRWPGRGGSNGG